MPEWVIVGESLNGEPVVVTDWPGLLTTARISDVKSGAEQPAVFRDRWRAKRVMRARNMWRNYRCIRREKL